MQSSRHQSQRQETPLKSETPPKIGQSRGKYRSEASLIPQVDILKENVKSSFALGYLRGMVLHKQASKEFPKTEIQLKREEQLGIANKQSKTKRLTFLKFGFRTHEKKNNYYLQPLQRKVKDAYGSIANDGSMGVVDLWSDRNINRLMDAIQMTRDNLIVRKMGKEINEADQFLMARMEEKRIRDRVMIDTLKMQQQDQDTFALKFILPERSQRIVKRIAQPTMASSFKNTHTSNNTIQNIVSSIDELHQENLVIYTDLYKRIKNIQKNLK